jgi:protein O-mannosyl-transferase
VTPRRSPKRGSLVVPFAVAAATFVAFLPVLQNAFVSWDDDKNFVDNPHFRGLGPEQLHWMWTTFHLGHYVPLSWMTLGFDYTLWGMNPLGYHLTNLLLHSANAVLVYAIARRLLAASRGTPESSDGAITLGAAAAALLFSIHPLRVESVAWATERRDVLSAFFALSSVLVYLGIDPAASSRRRYWSAVALFACGLLSKATVMSVPAVLLILNVYPLERLGRSGGWWSDAARRVYKSIVPFAILSLGAATLSIVALHPPSQLSVAQKLAVSAYSLAFYLWKTVVPVGLAPLYEMPQHVDPTETRFLASYVAVAALAAVAWLARKRAPGVTAAIAVFVVITLPMLGVVQNGPQIAADRYTYHAAPALAILAAAGYLSLPHPRALISVLGLGAVLLILGTLTWTQTLVWRSPESMWLRVLEVDSTSSIASAAMANVRYKQNRVPEGLAFSQKAVDFASGYAEGHDALGVGLARSARVPEAIIEYRKALVFKPGDDEAESNLGIALASAGHLDSAIVYYQRALAANPDNANAEINWGNALVRLGRGGEAIPHYEHALALQPASADAHLNWGVALALQSRYADAVEHFRAALAIDPDNAEAKTYLERASQLMRAPPPSP